MGPSSFNHVVLNLVAKLREIGAQLARKSTRSTSLSLYHQPVVGNLDPQALESIVRGTSPDEQQQSTAAALTAAASAPQSQQPGAPQAPGDALTSLAEAAASVAAHSDDVDPEEDQTAEESAGDEVSSEQGEHDDDSDSETDDGEKEDANGANRAAGEEEGSDDMPKCKTADCSDLFPTDVDTSSNHINPADTVSHEQPEKVLVTPIRVEINPTQFNEPTTISLMTPANTAPDNSIYEPPNGHRHIYHPSNDPYQFVQRQKVGPSTPLPKYILWIVLILCSLLALRVMHHFWGIICRARTVI